MIKKTHTRNQRRMYRIHKQEEQIEKDKYIIGSQQQEITRLNNIIEELEKFIETRYKKCEEFIETMDNKTNTNQVWEVATTVNSDRKEILDKLQELKEGK